MKASMRRYVQRLFLMMALMMTLLFSVHVSAQDIILVIDPGHGGAEGGASRGSYREEQINQKIANYLKAELDKYSGIQVYLTRTKVSQKAMNREDRVNIAKKKKADALVSIHINSTGATSQTQMTGAMAAVPSSRYNNVAATHSRKLATSILKGLAAKAGTKNNGFWYDDELGIILFAQKNNYKKAEATKLGISTTLLNTQIPSMIIEHCFVNNPNDCARFMSSDAKLKVLAQGDAQGIVNYFHLKKKSSGSVVQKPKKTGLVQDKNGTWYLYDANGNPRHGLCKYKTKYYYCDYDGSCAKKWLWIGNKHYYFGVTTSAGLSGLYKIGQYKYYFVNGYTQSKWITIKGKQYYFSKVNGRLLTNYWLNWEGKWYYLNANGTPWVSCKKVIDGKTYRFNAKGICTNK